MLGFYCDYRTEVYGVVWRDNAATHFAQADTPQYGAKIFFWLIDVNAYFEEVIKKGVKITHEIGNRDYGIRDFGLEDNNGFTLIFGQDSD